MTTALHLLTADELDSGTLAETAREAAGGGSVTSLTPARADRTVWRATVRGADGAVRAVRLDLRLRTVVVAVPGAARLAA